MTVACVILELGSSDKSCCSLSTQVMRVMAARSVSGRLSSLSVISTLQS